MFDALLKSNKKIFVYEEASLIGSLGSILCTYAENNNYKNNITCFGIKDEFIRQGHYDLVLESLKLDPESISKKIEEKLK